MRKELVVAIVVIFLFTLFTTSTTQAVDPEVSVQPVLIQDETVKPLDPPLESHPTVHQYTAPVTDPADAYDNNQLTYSFTNISLQPYPMVYSRPSAYTGSATVSNPANAYDLNLDSYAEIDVRGTTPTLRDFTVQTFNTTAITTISSLDVHIKYNITINEGSRPWYKMLLFVGTKNETLLDLTYTQMDIDTTTGNWTALPEPNDGLWSQADVGNIRIGIYSNRSATSDRATIRVFEVWTHVYSPVIQYSNLRTFSPTGISSFSYLTVNINCSIIVGGCSYRIIMSVGARNATLQTWNDVSQLDPDILPLGSVTEPNDGWWDSTDLSNLRIIIETQKTKSQNKGEFRIYEAWVSIMPPTANLYPSAYEGDATVTNPSRAYDKNQTSYASINLPSTFGSYFAVKSFNTTTPSEYASVDIQMRYNVTTFGGGQYKIHAYVGGLSVDLQPPTIVNQTEPITAVWHGVCEPNDAVWSQADLTILQVRVETATEGGSCTFREYETWLTFPKDSLTVRVYVSDILPTKTLIGWTVNLTFNEDVLQLVNVADGPFLKQGGYFTNFAGYTVGDGWVYASSALDDVYSTSAYGSGALATVTFKPIARGNSMFNYTYTALRYFDPVWQMPRGIAHTRAPGWFQYLAGDVNGDAKVDVYDLYQLGQAYGTTSGNPSYDADADQDKDGDVDATDLTITSGNYGAT